MCSSDLEVVELLSQAGQQAGGGSQGMSASMAMLMQRLMGMGAGQMAGGNPSGGDTERPNNPTSGNPAGRAGEGRTVEKASGRDTSRFPAEFREALEGYFNNVEGLEK